VSPVVDLTAAEAFCFNDFEGLVMSTGDRAANLREFLDRLRRVPDDVVAHHLFRSFLTHRHGIWDHPNDFAAWAAQSLGDWVLAEKLSSLEPFTHETIDDAREAIVELIEDHLDTLVTVPWARPGFEFYFMSGRFLALACGLEARTLRELRDGITHVPLSSFYYHFHEARMRGPSDDVDDFTRWIEGQLASCTATERIRRLDFYFFSLDEIRRRVVRILDDELAGESA